MNTNEENITCEYIFTKGKFINQFCKVEKIFCYGMCKKHYTQEQLRKEKQIDDKVKEEKNTNEITNNIIFKLKKIIEDYNIDTIELKNILNIIEEEEDETEEVEVEPKPEPEPEPKPKPKPKPKSKSKPKVVVEKTKEEVVDELVEEKIQKVFKKYFYENGCEVKKSFEEVDREESNYDMKIYDDKYYKNFELVLCKLYKIKYRNNIKLFNTIKSYIDREYFHFMWCENKKYLNHKIFDTLMCRYDENEYVIED